MGVNFGAVALLVFSVGLVILGATEAMGVSPIGKWTFRVFGALLIFLGVAAIWIAYTQITKNRGRA